MQNNQENDKTLSFVCRWIKAFNRIFKIFGKREISNNTEFVEAILKDEQAKTSTHGDLETIEEKRKLLEELCEDVDTYYEKKAAADKAPDLDDWFKNEVKTFVQDTIPNANQEDIKEIEDSVSTSMEKEIEMRATMLESEFTDDESICKNYSPENDNKDE